MPRFRLTFSVDLAFGIIQRHNAASRNGKIIKKCSKIAKIVRVNKKQKPIASALNSGANLNPFNHRVQSPANNIKDNGKNQLIPEI